MSDEIKNVYFVLPKMCIFNKISLILALFQQTINSSLNLHCKYSTIKLVQTQGNMKNQTFIFNIDWRSKPKAQNKVGKQCSCVGMYQVEMSILEEGQNWPVQTLLKGNRLILICK